MTEISLTPYANLHKITEGSNKFYTLYIKEFKKDDSLEGTTQVAAHDGFQLYALYGKKTAKVPSIFNAGIFFTNIAAKRSAKRIKESKLQKGYAHLKETIFASNIVLDAPETNTESKPIEALFKELPKPVPKMTSNQKTRFLNLIE